LFDLARSRIRREPGSSRNAIKPYATQPATGSGHTPPAQISHSRTCLTSLLLRDTDGPTSSSSCLGVLSTDTKTPVVAETTMSTNLLQAFQIITKLRVDTVGENLAVLAIDDITLTIEKPGGDLVLGGILNNGDDAFQLFRGQFAGTVKCQYFIPLAQRQPYRLLRSTSAFLHTKLEYRRPTPFILVRA
jgi:hypothetical protein